MKKDLQIIFTEDKELWSLREEIYQQDYFFSATLEGISKHFLGYFSGFESIFSMPFENIREQFLIRSGKLDGEVPNLENDFFKFISYEYLLLDRAPYQCLLDIYSAAYRHVNEIKQNIAYCKQEKNRLEEGKKSLRQQGKPIDEQINHKSYMFNHYIQLNKTAEKEITEFVFSERVYTIARLKAGKDPYGINKGRHPYNFPYNSRAYDAKSLSDVTNKFLKLDSIRKLREAEGLYENSQEDFYKFMHEYIKDHKVVDEITSLISRNHYLDRRSYILITALEQYKNGNNAIFLHIAPLQIEGIFYDYCTALGIFEREIYTSSIHSKLDSIIKRDEGFYSFEYFKFKFPVIRNKIAHGKVMEKQEIDFFSDFMLLDLLDVSKRITSDDLRLNKILSYIKQAYEHNDETSLVALAFAISKKEVDIPEFYQVENKVNELKVRLQKDEFFAYLSKLISINNKIINGGVRRIVTYLKNLSILEEKCSELLKQTQDNYSNEIDLAKFIDEITQYPN